MIRAWYDQTVLPALIELACGQSSVEEQRRALIPQAQGRVLEIGFGTGLNLPFYDRARVQSLAGVDPSPAMRPRAEPRAREAGFPVTLLTAAAEDLPVPDAAFDTAVSTYTLCSVADPAAALRRLRRALKPGGTLLFSEHGLSPDASVRRWQRRLDRAWPSVAGGCHLTRDIPALLREAGFELLDLRQQYLPGPRPWTWHSSGRALPS